jgi:hypothetical protein
LSASSPARPYALVRARRDDEFRLLVDRTLAGIYRSGRIGQRFIQAYDP